MWLLAGMVEKASQPEAPVFSRRISLDDTAAFHGRFEATPEERARLTALFGVSDIGRFSCSYRIEPLSQHRYRLSGNLNADVTQECVVTLEPVDSQIEEPFSVEFWPETQIAADDSGEAEPDLDDDPPEAIADGKIDVGAFAAEILAGAIDPYPRKADVEFAWQDAKDGDQLSGPFAQLAKLKQDR